jgi:transcriptional regulator with XRE-family HTH domain
MMKLSKAISLRLKSLREAAGLSQQEVAMRADLSLSLVAKLEQGKKADPRASTLLALAEALAVRPGALLEDLFPPAAPAIAEPDKAGAGAEPGASLPAPEENGKTKGKGKGKGKKGKGKGKGKGKVKAKDD